MKTILIIGNEAGAIAAIAQPLEQAGHQARGLFWKDWAQAADSAADVVIIESIAPDGRDAALAAVGAAFRAPRVLLVDAHDPPSPDARSAWEKVRCLVRPFSDRELVLTVELAVNEEEAAVAVGAEEQFFMNALDLLCCLNFSGYFMRLNPAWERALGFTIPELMSRPFIEFVHPDDRARTLEQNARVRRGGQALAFENRYLCRDGSYRWLRWNATPDGGPRTIYGVARDVTDEKRAADEREGLVLQLQAALTEVSTLRKILPICSYCRKIRDDEEHWHEIEAYISRRTDTRFSHSICPDCMTTHVEPHMQELEA